jgi:hypothetical protein
MQTDKQTKGYLYEFVIFFVLMFELFREIILPQNIAVNYFTYPYLFSYKLMGFAERSFIGSVVNLLTGGDFVSQKFLWCFIFFFLVLICLLTAFLLGKFIKNSQDNIKPFAIALTALFLASPVSPAYLFYHGIHPNTMIYGDVSSIYPLLFLLLAIIILKSPKLNKLNFLIPVLCFLMAITHPSTFGTYFPVMIMLLFYETYIAKNKKPALFIFTCIMYLLLLVWFHIIIKYIYVTNMSGLFESLPKTNWINDGNEEIYKFNSMIVNSSVVKLMEIAFNSSAFLFIIVLTTLGSLLISPVIAFIISFWKITIKNEEKKIKKIFFILCALFGLFGFFSFAILLGDPGRMAAYYFIAEFVFIFYFIDAKEKSILFASEKILNFIKNNLFICIMTIIYLMLLGRTNPFFGFDIEFNLKALLIDLFNWTFLNMH